MHLSDFLIGAFVYLTAAVIAAPLFSRMGLGSVLGYLVAGIVIGPAVLGLIGREGQDVMHFAEFGVIVMLFLVGLELQPSKLWSLRKPILGLGGLQVVVTAAAIGLAAWLLGTTWQTAITVGLILAMSSTAIVLQSLQERGLLKTAAGQSCFSVLLFQDIAIIPIFALLPLIAVAHGADEHGTSLIADFPGWAQGVFVLAAVAVIILAGRYLMRPLFRLVAGSGIREIFVAFALLIVVGITLLMQFVGLSAALGTFLAGVVLAESEYRHELEMDLDPFKGLLLAVFFMAVGAGIDFSLLISQPLTLLGLVAGFVLIKLAVLFGLGKLFRMRDGDPARFSFSLAQGGEFAFVLISFAAGLGLLSGTQSGMLVAMVAISMAFAPLLMIFDDKVLQPRLSPSAAEREADSIEENGAHVIIAGHGRYGMTVNRLLGASGVKAVVLDHDAEQIDALRRFGYKVYYGDASRVDLLEAAGAKEAQALVIAVDDRAKVNEIADTARHHFPHLKLFARAWDRTHAYELINKGVDHVHRELFASSVEMGKDVLGALGRHPFEAHRAALTFATHDERLIRKSAAHVDDAVALVDIARKGRAEIENVLGQDVRDSELPHDHAWEAPDRTRE
ncbi:monovalent cation:proton antiporter-2 (CPA2) family protein [Aestuariivirga sp.]|uniref:monovalent cation:proton antiporter-2 (CPA2) family protein n=1 Tax=Aestuariivirga sp. TaxID=2650926 RepID=UPI0035938793